jgi:acyl-CoA synthetase (NDP forming)/RimJ/RimL family protein N-acetyltransferase
MADAAGGNTDTEYDALLVDGTVVHLRPPRPTDRPALAEMNARLSRRSAYFRYFSLSQRAAGRYLDAVLAPHDVDLPGLVALIGGQPVAIASYERVAGGEEAEIAFLVDDDHQGLGISTLLLEALAADASGRDITRFVADVLPENEAMLDVFSAAGFEAHPRFREGTVRVEFPLTRTETLLDAVGERERRADSRSIARLLAPSSVAVLMGGPAGATGRRILANLARSGYRGEVHPVSMPPTAGAGSQGRSPAGSHAVPPGVDLAVIAVPTETVLDAAADCAAAGVANVIVTTGGFSDAGPEGAQRETELVALARRAGMRLVGPHSLGLVNTAADVRLCAAPIAQCPHPGAVGIMSQSKALGVALLAETTRRGIGVSSFVSGGNTADVSGNDLLMFWEQDEATAVVVLYLERFGNPRKFARIARRLSRSKPVLVVASGRSEAGARAASPPRAPAPSEQVAVAALFAQTGAIRVSGVEELFPVLEVLLSQPLPTGRRTAIIGNSAGASALTADAAVAAGLTVSELSDATQRQLRAALPPAAVVVNPVDLLEGADPQDYRRAASVLLGSDEVDALLVTHTVLPGSGRTSVTGAITAAAADAAKPVVGALLAGRRPQRRDGRAGVPFFGFPETAARALARVSEYGRWRDSPIGTLPEVAGVDPSAAARTLREELAAHPGGRWLHRADAAALLTYYGIEVVDQVKPGRGSHAAADRLAVTIGLLRDPLFGPLVSLGGVTDFVDDVAYRILPLTDVDVAGLIRALRCSPLLFGYDGRPPLAVADVEDLLLRVSRLADHREITALTLAPVLVTTDAAQVTGVRLQVAPPVRAPSAWLRRLR